MKLKALFEDDGAVSPVIGVILMVAITVILAAVIGTFVLGLGDRVSQAQPSATFTFEYGTHGSSSPYDYVNITHDGGDGVTTDQLSVQIEGTEVWNGDQDYSASSDWAKKGGTNHWTADKITAGDTVDIAESGGDLEDSDTVKVIWTASGSDKTAVIGESEASL